MKNTIGMASILAILLATQASSAELFKCVDTTGRVTYVQHQCPNTPAQIDSIDVNNLPPSGAGKPSQMADPAILDTPHKSTVTIVESAPKPKSFTTNSQIGSEIEADHAARAQRAESQHTYP